jgi:hypothetical protein
MANKKMTEEEKLQWKELCEWMEINIFNYDIKTQRLQKKACLILKGLQSGQNVANNNCEKFGEYPFDVILMTFKANKLKIQNAIRNKNFEKESNKMFYICAIVRDKLNDMYGRYLNAQKTQEKVESVDTSIMTHEGAEYKTNNTERKINKRLEGLW